MGIFDWNQGTPNTTPAQAGTVRTVSGNPTGFTGRELLNKPAVANTSPVTQASTREERKKKAISSHQPVNGMPTR